MAVVLANEKSQSDNEVSGREARITVCQGFR
jgi:hypothetical protein